MVTIALRNKDTQPSQTCSEGYTFLLLHCTGVFLCFWGVLTRLDYTTHRTESTSTKRCVENVKLRRVSASRPMLEGRRNEVTNLLLRLRVKVMQNTPRAAIHTLC